MYLQVVPGVEKRKEKERDRKTEVMDEKIGEDKKRKERKKRKEQKRTEKERHEREKEICFKQRGAMKGEEEERERRVRGTATWKLRGETMGRGYCWVSGLRSPKESLNLLISFMNWKRARKILWFPSTL